MKKTWLMAIIIISVSFIINGCTSNQIDVNDYDSGYQTDYEVGYNNGYNDGYDNGYSNGYEDGLSEENYEDEYLEFLKTIVTLMYDYKYETVETLLEYYPEVVGPVLEQEFGTENISEIIDYLERERTVYPETIVGKCKYCGESVYNKDAVRILYIHEPSEISYAHKKCHDENEKP